MVYFAAHNYLWINDPTGTMVRIDENPHDCGTDNKSYNLANFDEIEVSGDNHTIQLRKHHYRYHYHDNRIVVSSVEIHSVTFRCETREVRRSHYIAFYNNSQTLLSIDPCKY